MSQALLLEHRRVWESKRALRTVYEHYYREVVRACQPGRTLEVGGGTGNLKGFMPDVISSDVQESAWLDVVADAQRLPFAPASFANIVMFDVLHHIERPRLFLEEAARILKPHGRVIVCEPAITPVSYWFYRHFHPEPVCLKVDPLARAKPTQSRDPWDSNQAIPTLIFGRESQRLARLMPSLRIHAVRRFGFFAYPLSGGFRPWSLLPHWLVTPLLTIEHGLEGVLGPLMAFRLLGVIEKCPEE
jgi:SAM-dependent methyltransferase